MIYLEDYLEDICNNHLDSLKYKDSIYFSIYSQVSRGIGLTDRQYALVAKKVKEYVNISDDVSTRIPLREIDRSKYVKVVERESNSDELLLPFNRKKNNPWIKIRFPFAKKDIVLIEELKLLCDTYYHARGSHEHYFSFTPRNSYHIYDKLCNRNFDIDNQIKEFYDKSSLVIHNRLQYVPHLKANTLKNVNNSIVKELELASTDIYYIQDKSIRYGFEIIDPKNDHTLASELSIRNEPEILAPPSKYSLNEIANAFLHLDRFPLIVLVDENDMYSQLLQIYSAFNGFIPNEEQSVMFRSDSKDLNNRDLNQFIKDKQLNNWVDKHTKIVYIKKNKLPKVLLASNFVPCTALSIRSDRSNNLVSDWVKFNCDLIVYNDDKFSSFKTWNTW
jgi:hypothetical protein